ncbi:WD domain, G-beta repeat protein [Dictyocaulus viviparus]|uniref:WD domain, G-beta repeat protein n=1 Tax=Dictyocaulus viviparus TaxID=29172 RepID=A0A0D8XBG2_DICVI|nr:WD domain, G-beta repeat protein [Dictyocaulus viviparus]
MSVVMVADVAWIQRGVAKKNPDRIKLDNDQLKQLIEGGVSDSSDIDSEPDAAEHGVRGSSSKEEAESHEVNDESIEDGIDDNATKSGDEEEKAEIEVKADDNLVVIAKIDKDKYVLEVFVYNEENSDWYCHHDYLLDAPPLCIEPIQHDPGNAETGKGSLYFTERALIVDLQGNLIAVGTMESVINIWDLDIMNAVVPVVNLGDKKKGRRRKRDGSDSGHLSAVLSLAWNKITPHVLASGGADKEILLWDLDEIKVAQAVPERTAEIQALSWHPAEESFILHGTLDGTVEVIDCRENTGIASAVKWNHFNPFYALFATDDGVLYNVDMRKPGQVVWSGRAHDGTVGGITLSSVVRGLLVTVGHDEHLCVWKIQNDGTLLKVHSMRQNIGALHAAQFNPDVATVCCIGGSSNDLIRVVDVSKMDVVLRHFS